MDADLLATFFALLLLCGTAGVVAAWFVPTLKTEVGRSALTVAAVVTVGASLGSLWFSESAGFVPCELCWYQRIAMYPLAVLVTIAAIRGDHHIRPYAMVLASAGGLISLYHSQVQLFPEQSSVCQASNPCSAAWVDALGFLTIPHMAAIAFALVIGLLALPYSFDPQEQP